MWVGYLSVTRASNRSDVKRASEYLAADVEMPRAQPESSVLVHAKCLDAFHEAHPSRWEVRWTVSEFLRPLTLTVNVDEITRE